MADDVSGNFPRLTGIVRAIMSWPSWSRPYFDGSIMITAILVGP
jgi:hypothetical protein